MIITTAELVAGAVQENSPYVCWFPCLARHLAMAENDARETAQLMIIRDDFHTARRVCHVCFPTADMLVSGKHA
jgi:hypothetical protein